MHFCQTWITLWQFAITSCPPTPPLSSRLCQTDPAATAKTGRRHGVFFRRRPCLDNKLPRSTEEQLIQPPPAAPVRGYGKWRDLPSPCRLRSEDITLVNETPGREAPCRKPFKSGGAERGEKKKGQCWEEMCQLDAVSQLITTVDQKKMSSYTEWCLDE